MRRNLAVIVVATLVLSPRFAAAQGLEARAVHARLLPLAGAATFAATVARESSALISLEDAAWLNGSLATAAKNAGQKKALLTEQAALLELLGRYRDAAVAWEAAASALPGPADASCLISAAVCRLAAGEGELAAGLATAVGFLSPDAHSAQLASLVSGWAALARGEPSVAAELAGTVLSDADSLVTVPALLLARASTEGAVRDGYQKRLSAYPNRPEAVSTLPLFLLSGTSTRGERVPAEAAPPVSVPQAELTYYQVGAFRDESNARLLVKKLEGLGHEPLLKFKPARELHLVYVHAGQDTARTVLVLKDAGYEAWAVDGVP